MYMGMDGWMDGSIHQMLLYFVPCTTYVCMYVYPVRRCLRFSQTHKHQRLFIPIPITQKRKNRQADRRNDRTNGTERNERKEQKGTEDEDKISKKEIRFNFKSSANNNE